jgi:hypothetical protein
MSDNYRISINIELYDQHSMAFDQRGEIIVSLLKDAVESRLKEIDFREDGFFVSASGC